MRRSGFQDLPSPMRSHQLIDELLAGNVISSRPTPLFANRFGSHRKLAGFARKALKARSETSTITKHHQLGEPAKQQQWKFWTPASASTASDSAIIRWLDPHCIDVIIRRYEAATGTSAILVDTDEPFATVAARRRDGKDGERQSSLRH
jgi:hypothetical protein